MESSVLWVGIPPRTAPFSSEKETVSVVCLSFALTSLTDTCNFPLMLQTFEPAESERTVTHMFYTAWPDHGVPYNTMSLVSFIRRVRDQHPASSTAPLLVHCSAGGGKDGDFSPPGHGHPADEERGNSECVQQPAEYEEPENEDGAHTSECLREQVGKERGPKEQTKSQ